MLRGHARPPSSTLVPPPLTFTSSPPSSFVVVGEQPDWLPAPDTIPFDKSVTYFFKRVRRRPVLHSRSGPVSSVSSVRDVALRSVSSVRDLAACMSSLTLITLLVWFKRPCTVCPPSCCGKGGGFNEVYQNRVRFCPAEALHIFVMPRKRKFRLKGQRTTFGKIWVNLPLPCPAKDVGWRKRSGLPLQCRQHQMSDVLRNAVNTFYISSVAERVTTVSMWDSHIPGWTRGKELAWAKQEAKRLAQNYINKLDDIFIGGISHSH